MSYRIDPLPLSVAQPLFALSDADLAAIGARRMISDAPNSAPCRVSLRDAAPAESLILFNHVHLTEPASPYRAGGPISCARRPSRPIPPSIQFPTCCRAACSLPASMTRTG